MAKKAKPQMESPRKLLYFPIERPCFMVVFNVERTECDLDAIKDLLVRALQEQFRGTEAEDFAVALVPSRLELLGLLQ